MGEPAQHTIPFPAGRSKPETFVLLFPDGFELLIMGRFSRRPSGAIVIAGHSPDLSLFFSHWQHHHERRTVDLSTPTLLRDGQEPVKLRDLRWSVTAAGRIRISEGL